MAVILPDLIVVIPEKKNKAAFHDEESQLITPEIGMY